MASLRELKRRIVLPLIGLGLAAYLLFVLVPLAHRAEALDAPLQRSWQTLATSLGQSNSTTIDFRHITNQFNETRQALDVIGRVKQHATGRLELAAEIRTRMAAPFQLVDYENERSRQLDELRTKARQHKITVDPAVYGGFPEHTANVRQPALLWPALAFIDDLLTIAIQSRVAAIHSLDVPLALGERPRLPAGPAEIPLEIELTGAMTNVASLIQSLPLRAEEIRAAGLPEAPAHKAALFVDRLVIKKQSPDKADEVRVSLRVVGFVFHD